MIVQRALKGLSPVSLFCILRKYEKQLRCTNKSPPTGNGPRSDSPLIVGGLAQVFTTVATRWLLITATAYAATATSLFRIILLDPYSACPGALYLPKRILVWIRADPATHPDVCVLGPESALKCIIRLKFDPSFTRGRPVLAGSGDQTGYFPYTRAAFKCTTLCVPETDQSVLYTQKSSG